MDRPDHLDPPRAWLTGRVAAVIALGLGVLAFVVALIAQDRVWLAPDWRITVPGLVLTAVAAVASLARRERAYGLWLAGLGLAGAAVVLGWFLMLAIVVGATVTAIVILHAVM